MRRFIPVLIVAALTSGGAFAQSINLGPGGVSVDPRSERERSFDRESEIRRDERARERERDRRRDYRAERRGDDCRVVVTRRETPRGTIRSEERVCD